MEEKQTKSQKLNAIIDGRFETLSDDEVKKFAKIERGKTIAASVFAMIWLPLMACLLFYFSKDPVIKILCIVSGVSFLILALGSAIYMIFDLKKSNMILAKRYLKREIKPQLKGIVENGQEQQELKTMGFEASKSFTFSTTYSTDKLFFDNTNKQFIALFIVRVPGTKVHRQYSKIYKYSDIISYEISENGKQVLQGSVGKSLVGGFFFGLPGAIAGSSVSKQIDDICLQLNLLIRVNDFDNPQITLALIQEGSYEKNSAHYISTKSTLQAACAQLEYIINFKTLEQSAVSQSQHTPVEKSSIGQLQDLKEMLDSGLITQEDYELKKKQILGL